MQTPQSPRPQVVVVKSGCGKAALILGIMAGIACLAVGGCFVLGIAGIGKAVDTVSKEVEKQNAAAAALAANLEIVDFKWAKEGFGSVMEADFKIRNNGPDDLKDIEITCQHAAPSGTMIDKNVRTIYEVVKAGETKEFKNFSMGFIDSQATKSGATVTKAVKVIP
jgi:predicted RNA methylase